MTGSAELLRYGTGAPRSPGRALLFLRMLLWARVLPVLKRRMPLPRLVAVLWVDRARPTSPTRNQEIARLAYRAVTFGGRPDNCLERSLLTYRALSASGARPSLVVGTRAGEHGIEGHTWVTVDGVPVHDSPTDVSSYAVMAVFTGRGRPGRVA